MGESVFSKEEAIKFGWNSMKQNLAFLIGVQVFSFGINIIFSLTDLILKEIFVPLIIPMRIVSWVIEIIIGIGMIKIYLKLCDNIKPEFRDLFLSYHLFFKYFIGTILFGLIIFAGLILFIVPGIIFALMFGLYHFYIVDKEVGPIRALEFSYNATKGAKWDLFVFGIMISLINMLGMLCCCVGIFATIPTTMIASCYVYRKLSGALEEPAPYMYPPTEYFDNQHPPENE